MNKIQYDENSRKLMIHDLESNLYFKDNQRYFLQLKNLVETDPGMHRKMVRTSFQELAQWIRSCVPFLNDDKYSYWTRAYFIFNGYTDFPLCQVCCKNKIVGRNVSTPVKGFKFTRSCSSACRQKDPERIKNMEQTVLKKYGVKNINQHKETREQATRTRKNKNNGKYFSDFSLDKLKQTCLDLYGVENYAQTDQYKIQSKQSFLKHYGVDNNMKCEVGRNELKQVLLDKYGVDNAAKCPEIQDKIRTRYHYNGINFDAMPELAFFIWLSDNNIEFKYHHGYFFDYQFDGKQHRYFPDFKISDQFYEIKGDQFFKGANPDNEMICPYRNKNWSDERYLYECEKYEAKHKCMIEHGIIIMTSRDYQKYLDYVEEKYGKNYLKQFRKSKPETV